MPAPLGPDHAARATSEALGDTSPHTPLPEELADPAAAQYTQLMQPLPPEPIPPFDPQAAQYTQVVPVVPTPAPAPAPVALTSTAPTITAGSRVVIVVSRGPSDVPPSAVSAVPQVVGMDQGEALSQLQQAGLCAQVFNEYSELPRGEVVGQTPLQGSMAPVGSEAVLLVSGGPAPASTLAVLLPDVVGLSEADAIARLQQAGLSPQIVRDFHATVPLGVVIEQLPSGQPVIEAAPKPRSLWWLWLLLAASMAFAAAGGVYYYFHRTAAVPNLIGLTQAQAEQAIQAAGFKKGSVSTTQTLSASEVGKVTSQTPSPNAQLKLVDQVNIVVSSGQRLFALPNVTGKTLLEARSELTSAGMEASVTTEPSTTLAADVVISQSPAAGEKVANGTKVALVVSSGAGGANTTVPGTTTIPTTTVTPSVTQHYVTVPNVVNQTQSSAESNVKKAGLIAGSVTTAASSSVAKGRVISQYPAAKASVVANTTVTLTISSGKPPAAPVVMPALAWGSSQATAKKKLDALPLKYKMLSQAQFDVAAGRVVGQYPPAGTSLVRNATVLIVVASTPSVEASDVISVPDVTYSSSTYSISTSKSKLVGIGLSWQTSTGWSGATSGRVLAQVPAGGTLPRNSKVVLITK